LQRLTSTFGAVDGMAVKGENGGDYLSADKVIVD
jgi:hypothetical protein